MTLDMTVSLGNVLTILSILLGGGIAWGVLRQRVEANAADIQLLRSAVTLLEKCQNSTSISLARIETDLSWLRQSWQKVLKEKNDDS